MKALARFFGGGDKKKKKKKDDSDAKVNKKVKTKQPSPVSDESDGDESNEIEGGGDDDEMVVEIEENQRFDSKIWSGTNLLEEDPANYVSSAGNSKKFPDPPIADGWTYVGEWCVIHREFLRHNNDLVFRKTDMDVEGSHKGWLYASSFKTLQAGKILNMDSSKQASKAMVRRRRWVRGVVEVKDVKATSKLNKSTPRRTITREDGKISSPRRVAAKDGDDSDEGDDDDDLSGPRDFEVEVIPDDAEAEKVGTIDGDRRSLGGFFGFNSTAKAAIHDPSLHIKDPILAKLGQDLRKLEDTAKRSEEQYLSDFKWTKKPELKSKIATLEKRCEKLRARIQKEVDDGLEHIVKIEDDLKLQTESLEALKRSCHFPMSEKGATVLGQGGKYAAFDDFWLEQASGHFILNLIPHKDTPHINLRLGGANIRSRKKSDTSGMVLTAKFEGFKLAGDSGTGVPKLKLDSVLVTIGLHVSIALDFNIAQRKWFTTPKNFRLEILSFKGPYGLNKSVVSLMMSMVTPALRNLVIAKLPHELGAMIKTFPSAWCVEGRFEMSGVALSHLPLPLGDSPLASKVLQYSALQMEIFQCLQKSMERKKMMRWGDGWDEAKRLWEQAVKLYCEKIILIKTRSSYVPLPDEDPITDPAMVTITFAGILRVAEEVSRKRLAADFKLKHVDGKVSVKELLRHSHNIVHRFALEARQVATPLEQVRLTSLADRIQSNYEMGLNMIKAVCRNLDWAQIKIKASMEAGPQGTLSMSVNDIHAQAPLLLKMLFNREQRFGFGDRNLVKFTTKFKPHDNGDVTMEMSYCTEDLVSDASTTAGRMQMQVLLMRLAEIEAACHLTKPTTSTHTIFSIVASSPHVSMVVDKDMTLSPRAGAELFTIAVGPKEKGWKPFGSKNMSDMSDEKERRIADADNRLNPNLVDSMEDLKDAGAGKKDKGQRLQSKSIDDGDARPRDRGVAGGTAARERGGGDERRREKFAKEEKKGCPVLMQTGPGIKMMAQVPKAEVNLDLSGLIRFIAAHFTDLAELRHFCERKFGGGDWYEENLEIGKVILERFSKYLLLPGLELDFNLNVKIETRVDDILLTFETPASLAPTSLDGEVVAEDSLSDPNPSPQPDGRSKMSLEEREKVTRRKAAKLCAVLLHAELYLQDIFDDSRVVEETLKNFVSGGAGSFAEREQRGHFGTEGKNSGKEDDDDDYGDATHYADVDGRRRKVPPKKVDPTKKGR